MTTPVQEPASEGQVGQHRRTSLRALGGLTGVQLLQLGGGLVTGPLLARALGAEGRGLLAAIAVPLGLIPFIVQIGLGSFAVNKVASGIAPRLVFGTLIVPMVLVGGLVALLSPAIADVLSRGRQPVETFLIIGLATLPVAQLVTLLQDISWGLSRWRTMILTRALPPAVALVATVVLYAVDQLTVTSAAIVALVGNAAPLIVVIPVLLGLGRPRFSGGLLREGLRFGMRAWPGTLASLANLRLDQLLMVPLVPARQLGLYAIAVTIASLSSVLTGQVTTVLLPRIANGERWLITPTVRSIVLVVVVTEVFIAAGTLLFLVPIFGSDFADARWLVLVLLVSSLALALIPVLGQALTAIDRAGAPSLAELVSLAITVPGLVVLLPKLGAMGAAIVSVMAYSASAGVLLQIMRRELGTGYAELLLPRRADVRFLYDRFAPLVARLFSRVRSAGRR